MKAMHRNDAIAVPRESACDLAGRCGGTASLFEQSAIAGESPIAVIQIPTTPLLYHADARVRLLESAT